jgi:alpha-beta hydrolase superfamily lysophospholipase
MPADSAARGTVILFHGLTMNKGRLLQEAGEFHYWGYHVLLVDFRAHGNSEGKTTSLGWRESEEVKLAYEFIRAKGETNIFLAGFSMGAVAILKAIPEFTLKPSGIILEMPFGSLQDHLRGRARTIGFGGFPERPFAFFTSFWMGVRLGYSGWGFRMKKFAEQVQAPVLLQWGDEDRLTLRRETESIFNAFPGSDKKWVIYKGADHQRLLDYDPALWRSEVGRFLDAHTR